MDQKVSVTSSLKLEHLTRYDFTTPSTPWTMPLPFCIYSVSYSKCHTISSECIILLCTQRAWLFTEVTTALYNSIHSWKIVTIRVTHGVQNWTSSCKCSVGTFVSIRKSLHLLTTIYYNCTVVYYCVFRDQIYLPIDNIDIYR